MGSVRRATGVLVAAGVMVVAAVVPVAAKGGKADAGLTVKVDVESVARRRAEGSVRLSGLSPAGDVIEGSGTVRFSGRREQGGFVAERAVITYDATVGDASGSGTLRIAIEQPIEPGALVLTLGNGPAKRVMGDVYEGTGI